MTTRSVTHTGPGPPHKTQGSHDIWWAATEWDMTWNTVTSVTNTRDEERDTISQSEGEKALSWPIRSSRSQADNPTGSVTIVTIMWRYCVSRHFLVSSCSRNLGFLCPRLSRCHHGRHIVPGMVLVLGTILGASNIDSLNCDRVIELGLEDETLRWYWDWWCSWCMIPHDSKVSVPPPAIAWW